MGKHSLVFFLLTMIAVSFCQEINNSIGETEYDGVTPDITVNSLEFSDGKGCLKVTNLPDWDSAEDYLIMFYLKFHDLDLLSFQDIFELTSDIKFYLDSEQNLVLEDLKQSGEGNTLSVSATYLQQKRWLHIEISGSKDKKLTYLQVRYNDQTFASVQGPYLPITSSKNELFLGNSQNIGSKGLSGNIRDFLIAKHYTSKSDVIDISNQVFYWDRDFVVYFRFRDHIRDQFYLGATATYESFLDVKRYKPELVQETGIPDMCQEETGFIQVPHFEKRSSIKPHTLGSHYQQNQDDYAYTMSMWIKIQPGLETEKDEVKAKNDAAFVHLKNVFYCYLETESSFRCFVEAQRSFQSLVTKELTLPLDQWINIQFAFSRYKNLRSPGNYDLRVYSETRKLQFQDKDEHNFGSQVPSKQLYLFENFKGSIRDFVLFETQKKLPYTTPADNGDYTKLKSSSLLMYINFDKSNYLQQKFRTGISKSLTETNLEKGSYEFQYQEWKDLEFGKSYPYGTLDNKESLFDGLACNDQFIYPKIQFPTSALEYNIPELFLEQDLYELCVEFWFMREKAIVESNTLFTIATSESPQEVFSVYFDNEQRLLCAPFGRQESGKELYYQKVKINLEDQWQHVVCMYSQEIDLLGMYTVYDSDELLIDTDFYVEDLPKEMIRPFKEQNYTVILGNDLERESAIPGTFYREVKVWDQPQSFQKMKQHMFLQYERASPSLLSYMKLASNFPLFKDYGLGYGLNNEDLTLVSMKNREEFQVCAFNTYSSTYKKGKCLQNPFKSLEINQFLHKNKTLTVTAEYSDMWSYTDFDQIGKMQYKWQLLTQTSLQGTQIKKQENYERLDINTQESINDFSDFTTYEYQTWLTNHYSTFQVQKSQKLSSTTCRYMVDSVTDSPMNNLGLEAVRGEQDIVYTIYVKQFQECQGTESQISSSLPKLTFYSSELVKQSKVSKPLSIKSLSDTTIRDTIIEQTYQLSISKSIQKYLSIYEPFRVLVTQEWTDRTGNLKATQSVGYNLQFIHSVELVFSKEQSVLLIGDSLDINGSGSYLKSVKDPLLQKEGIQYEWQCHKDFKRVCQDNESNLLNVSFDQFEDWTDKNYGYLYKFTLVAWHSSDLDKKFLFTKDQEITWRQIEYPEFSIISELQNGVATSQGNKFYLNLLNYSGSSPLLKIDWLFSPEISKPESLVFSEDRLIMTVPPGLLKKNTKYFLSAKVTNIQEEEKCYTEKQLNFRTADVPKSGQHSITPGGTGSLETEYTISIRNWKPALSDASVYFDIYKTVTNLDSEDLEIKLNQKPEIMGQNMKTFLPSMKQIVLKVWDDQTYEQVVKKINLKITPSQSFQFYIDQLKTLPMVQFYQSAKQVSLSLDHFDSQVDSLGQRTQIREQLLQIVRQRLEEDNENEEEGFSEYRQVVSILPVLVDENVYFTDQVFSDTMLILNQLNKLKETVYQELIKDQVYRQYLIQLFQNILDNLETTITRIELTLMLEQDKDIPLGYEEIRNRRGLQEIENVKKYRQQMEQMMERYDQFTQVMCQSVQNQYRWGMETKQLALDLQWIEEDTKQLTQSFMNSDISVTLPIYKPSKTDHMCLRLSYLNYDPLNSETEPSQFLASSRVLRIQTGLKKDIDSLFSARLLDNNAQTAFLLQDQVVNGTQIVFQYDFEQEIGFRTNQVMCMWFTSSSKKWTNKDCNTVYDTRNKEITCICRELKKDAYYSLILDISRNDEIPPEPERQYEYFEYKRDWRIYAVMLFMFFFIFFGTFAACCLDSIDFSRTEQLLLQKDEDLLLNVAMIRKQPLQAILYKKQLVFYLRNKSKNVTCCGLFFIYMRYQHPCFSLCCKFDPRFKRATRFALFLSQWALATYLIMLRFIVYKRADSERVEDRMDETDWEMIWQWGLAIGTILLPLPQWFTQLCCKSNLVRERYIYQKKSKKYLLIDTDDEDTQIDVDLNKGDGPDLTIDKNVPGLRHFQHSEEQKNIDEKVFLVDSCVPCKAIFLLIVQGVNCLLMYQLWIYSPDLSQSQDRTLLIAWACILFGGLFGWNLLRVCCMSTFAKCVVDSEPRKSVCAYMVDFLCVNKEAKKTIRLIYAIDEARQRIEESKHTKSVAQAYREQHSQLSKTRQSQLKEQMQQEEEDEDVRYIEKKQRRQGGSPLRDQPLNSNRQNTGFREADTDILNQKSNASNKVGQKKGRKQQRREDQL